MWDEPALRRVLNWTAELGDALEQNADRASETADLMSKARDQAKPHPVGFQEVSLHAPCKGDGCPPCGRSGVVHESGAPFIPRAAAAQAPQRPAAPASPAELANMRRQLEQVRAAHERMRKLAEGFELLADRLDRAAALARRLGRDLNTIVGARRP